MKQAKYSFMRNWSIEEDTRAKAIEKINDLLDDDDEYDDYIDDEYGDYQIADRDYNASEILKAVDYDRYEEFREESKESLCNEIFLSAKCTCGHMFDLAYWKDGESCPCCGRTLHIITCYSTNWSEDDPNASEE